jgi:hypothetical protein
MSEPDPDPWGEEAAWQPNVPESEEAAKARRRRSLALAIGLVLFAVIIFLVTIARLGGHVADRHF